MSIEAMKQALEYLDSPSSKLWPAGTQYNIITTLRLAVEQAERQESYWQEEARRYAGNADFWREKAKRQPMVVSQECAERGCMAHDDRVDGPGVVIEPQEKQEPVAYDKTELNCFAQDLYDQKMREGKRGHYESMFHVIHQCVKKVATPPAAQPCPTCEALARTVMMDQTAHDTQRQPLTDEQIDAVCAPLGFAQLSPREVARAIEAAHNITGEKK